VISRAQKKPLFGEQVNGSEQVFLRPLGGRLRCRDLVLACRGDRGAAIECNFCQNRTSRWRALARGSLGVFGGGFVNARPRRWRPPGGSGSVKGRSLVRARRPRRPCPLGRRRAPDSLVSRGRLGHSLGAPSPFLGIMRDRCAARRATRATRVDASRHEPTRATGDDRHESARVDSCRHESTRESTRVGASDGRHDGLPTLSNL
jgi:hypothetical protein